MDGYDSISDTALVEAAQGGDRDAAACLYHRHVDRVGRICYRIVLDRTHMADCVQEVWCKVFGNLDQFAGRSSFGTWLNSVAARTAIDYCRKKRRRRYIDIEEVSADVLPAIEPGDEQKLDNALLQRRIHEALADISASQRTAFVLRYIEEMSPAEIAGVLGCREGTVRTHIQRCLVALRGKLAANSISEGSRP